MYTRYNRAFAVHLAGTRVEWSKPLYTAFPFSSMLCGTRSKALMISKREKRRKREITQRERSERE
jgi:hypothetical protein